MCLGSIPWSGVGRVVCAATGADAELIGFDEGAKPTDWVKSLESRGIRVVRELLREEGRAVLSDYAAAGGVIY
jgi:tRNA(Arg) A34 adenosine deaminase TadA